MRRGRSRIGIITVVDSADTKRYTVHKSGGTSNMLLEIGSSMNVRILRKVHS